MNDQITEDNTTMKQLAIVIGGLIAITFVLMIAVAIIT